MTPRYLALPAFVLLFAQSAWAARANLFTSRDQVGDAVAAAVAGAAESIDLALYSLKLPKAAKALLAKAEAGVPIRLIIEAGHADAPEVRALADAGAEVRKLAGVAPRGLMHNKVALLDGRQLIAGSFNWTSAADGMNLENCVLRDEPQLVAGYRRYWDWMWARAAPLDGPAGEGAPRGPPPADPAPGLWFKGEAWPSYAFSPKGGTEDLLARAIERSRTRIEGAIFSFYSQRLADALIAAHRNGVRVRLVLDAGQAERSEAVKSLARAGVPVRLRSGRGSVGVMHHKFAVFDGELLETGAFNWSFNAENNSYENVLFSTAAEDLSAFEDEFERIFGESAPLYAEA